MPAADDVETLAPQDAQQAPLRADRAVPHRESDAPPFGEPRAPGAPYILPGVHLPPLLLNAVLLAGGVLAGTLGALVGVGGGVIVVPLVTLLGFDVRFAFGASAVSVIATSSGAAAAYVRDRVTNLRAAIFLEMFTTTGALVGALLQPLLSGAILSFAFAGVLGASALGLLVRPEATERREGRPSPGAQALRLSAEFEDPALGRKVRYDVHQLALGSFLMFIAGNVSGLLGIGSGALKVPAMDLAMGMPIKASSATSDFMIGVTAAVTVGIYLARGEITPELTVPIGVGVLAGSWLGTRLIGRLRGRWVRRIFMGVLLAIAAQMVWHALRRTYG